MKERVGLLARLAERFDPLAMVSNWVVMAVFNLFGQGFSLAGSMLDRRDVSIENSLLSYSSIPFDVGRGFHAGQLLASLFARTIEVGSRERLAQQHDYHML